MVKIWKFEKSPMEYRLLHSSGQDVDWIAHVPTGEDAKDFGALLTGAKSVNSTERRVLADGSSLYFGRSVKNKLNPDEREMAIPTSQDDR